MVAVVAAVGGSGVVALVTVVFVVLSKTRWE